MANFYETEIDKANLIAKSIAESSKDSNYNQQFQLHRKDMEIKWANEGTTMAGIHVQSLPDIEQLNDNFELHELIQAIKQTKSKSAPGEDELTYELLKHLPKTSLKHILQFYNHLWNNGQIVPEWKEALIIPLHKPGTDKSLPASYRPISLTSALCKINERIITTRLTWFLEKNIT